MRITSARGLCWGKGKRRGGGEMMPTSSISPPLSLPFQLPSTSSLKLPLVFGVSTKLFVYVKASLQFSNMRGYAE